MNKRTLFLVFAVLISGAAIASVAFMISRPEFQSILFPRAALPTITFLGEGGTFEARSGEYLILKLHQSGAVARFEVVAGPVERTLEGEDRAWLCVGDCENFMLHYRETIDFGRVSANSEVTYIGIDDDQDERINIFYLDGEEIHTIEQGMVFSGSFRVPREGQLSLKANDSVEAHVEVSRGSGEEAVAMPTEEVSTPTPFPTETPVLEAAETFTPTPEEEVVLTPTSATSAFKSVSFSTSTPTSPPESTPTPITVIPQAGFVLPTIGSLLGGAVFLLVGFLVLI